MIGCWLVDGREHEAEKTSEAVVGLKKSDIESDNATPLGFCCQTRRNDSASLISFGCYLAVSF